MEWLRTLVICWVTILVLTLTHGVVAAAEDPLPSWNDGAVKQSVLAFIEKVAKEGGSEFVPQAERIAAFDNDGTLWAEQPIYFQVQFALDRVKALAPKHPEWKNKQPFKAVLEGDKKAFAAGGDEGDPRGHGCVAHGHDDGGVRGDRQGLARDGEAPTISATLQ